MQSVTLCPICESNAFSHYLTCKDYTVSHETFTLIQCKTCAFVLTSPRPSPEDLPRYYLSDSYISHAKATNNIFSKIYQISRVFTLRWKLNLTQRNIIRDGKLSVLDFGCGTGEFLYKCKTAGHEVTGVEPSTIARSYASERIGKEIHASLDPINKTFDVITLWHVLEHIPNLNETIVQLKARLKEQGTLFIAVPNRSSKDAQHYKDMWAAFDVPRHLWHFSENNMKDLLSRHSLRLIKIIPMKLDAFYVSMLSEKNKKGTNGPLQLLKGFISGLVSNLNGKKNNQYSSLIYVIRK